MNIKISFGERVFRILNTVFMVFMIAVTLYPFYYVLMGSLSDGIQLVGYRGPLFKPLGTTLNAYRSVFKNPNILTGYRNTVIIVLVGTTLNVIMTSMSAFLLTRKSFAIKNFLAYMMIFTMYFSGGLIPTYLVVFNVLGLGDSLGALILPTLISVYNVIIMRSNFAAIPQGLEESARIDGANEFVIFSRIIMPLSMPIIAVMILFYGVNHWNSWFNAMIYLRTREKYPLQLVLREILLSGTADQMAGSSGADQYALGESVKYATIIVATVPILAIYPFIQKYFVKGIMVGAIKG